MCNNYTCLYNCIIFILANTIVSMQIQVLFTKTVSL